MHDKILILDFGSQVTQLIARRVRDARVYSEIHPYDCDPEFIRKFIKEQGGKGIILSGGLTPANVRQAIESTHPAAVDVASGVESSPGIKDLNLVREFIEQSRGAD